MNPSNGHSAGLALIVALALSGCRGGLAAPCEQDEDCKHGLFCWSLAGVWQNPQGATQCTQIAPCEDGERSVYGFCSKLCSSDEDCPSGTLCNDRGDCAVVCENDEECSRSWSLTCPEPGELCQ